MDAHRISACGDDLLSIDVRDPSVANQLSDDLRASGDWLEVVAGIDSVVVRFDATRTDFQTALHKLAQVPEPDVDDAQCESAVICIPVAYGGEHGPDLKEVCAHLGIAEDEFVAMHTRDEHAVELIGFTPGYAYIGGFTELDSVARLAEPRVLVPAGSIGVAGGKTGVYAMQGPGGWPLIGRTSLALFDASAEQPFKLRAGMRVRFRQSEEQR